MEYQYRGFLQLSWILLGLCQLRRLRIQHFLDSRARNQLLVPLVAVWVVALPLLIEVLAHDEPKHHIPWNEHQVCIGDLVANQVWLTGSLQVQVNHAEDTLDFVTVTLNGASDVFLCVELNREPDQHMRLKQCDLVSTYVRKPSLLAEVWALARHLEVLPLLLVVLLWRL